MCSDLGPVADHLLIRQIRNGIGELQFADIAVELRVGDVRIVRLQDRRLIIQSCLRVGQLRIQRDSVADSRRSQPEIGRSLLRTEK